MSGVAICRYILANNGPLVSAVPASKIMAGVLPLLTVLPAIAVTQVSGVGRNVVAMNNTSAMITERVQVTIASKSYPTQKSILALVRAALGNTNGTVNGIKVDSILDDSIGPDFYDADALDYFQTHDFIVKWQE